MEAAKITLPTKTNSYLATLTNFLNMNVPPNIVKNLDFIGSFVITLVFVILFIRLYNREKDNKKVSKAYKNYLISLISITTILNVSLLLTFIIYPGLYNYVDAALLGVPLMVITLPILIIFLSVAIFGKF